MGTYFAVNTLRNFDGVLNGPGSGGIAVSKSVSGPGSGIAATCEFAMNFSWVDNAGTSHTEKRAVAPGKSAELNNLPTGAKVTVSEDSATACAGVESFTPKFSSSDGSVEVAADAKSAVVTVRDQSVVNLAVDNAIVSSPEPTTEPTASPTTEPTASPTTEPTASPTTEPTASPTASPTGEPTPTGGPVPPAPTSGPMPPAPTLAPSGGLAHTGV